MKSNNDEFGSSSTLSAAPSITASKTSFTHSKFSLKSDYSQSVHSVRSVKSQKSQESKRDKIEELLEKAKFYTSLCLGKKLLIYS